MAERLWLRLEYVLLCSLLLVLPSFMDTGYQTPTITPKVLLTVVVSCILALLWALRRVIWRGTVGHFIAPLPFLLMGGYLAFHLIQSEYFHYALRASLYSFPALFLGLYTSVHVRGQRERTGVLLFLLLASLPVAVYAILQSFGVDYVQWDVNNDARQRIGSTLGNPSYVGDYLAVCMVLLVGLVLSIQKRWLRVVACLYFPIAGLAILRTLSRGPWLLVTVGIISYLLMAGRFRELPRLLNRRVVLIALAVLVLVVIVLGFLVSRMEDTKVLLERFREGIYLQESSVQLRLTVWEVTTRLWLKHFWLGSGLHQFRVLYLDELYELLVTRRSQAYSSFLFKTNVVQADNAHNDYLQILAEWGVFGMAAWTLILATAFSLAFRRMRAEGHCTQQGSSHWQNFAAIASMITLLADAAYAFPFQLPVTNLMGFVLLGCMVGYGQEPARGAETRVPRLVSALILITVIFLSGKALQQVWHIDRGERQILQALSAESAGKSDVALRHYQEAYHYLPENGELSVLIGASYSRLGQMSTARDFYEKAHLTYNNPTLYLNRAMVALETRRYEECERLLERVESLVPNHPQVHYLRGLYLYLRGSFEDAEKEFRAELKNSKTDLNTLLYLGQTLVHLEKSQVAENTFRRAVHVSPRNMVARENLGDLYSEQLNLPQQALTEYTIALEIARKSGNGRAEYRIQRKLDQLQSQ